jgi:hypothetical protein
VISLAELKTARAVAVVGGIVPAQRTAGLPLRCEPVRLSTDAACRSGHLLGLPALRLVRQLESRRECYRTVPSQGSRMGSELSPMCHNHRSFCFRSEGNSDGIRRTLDEWRFSATFAFTIAATGRGAVG